MEVWDIYAQAVDAFKAKDYDAALALLAEIQRREPGYRQAYMLESYIWDALHNFVKEFDAMSKLLRLFNPLTPDIKETASHTLGRFAIVCRVLAIPEDAIKFAVLAAEIAPNNTLACREMSRAIFEACGVENFSSSDFRALYADYKKYLSDITPFPRRFYAHDKIRIGFLSADFRNHSVMRWSWTLLTKLDKGRFDVYCYSSGNKSDVVTNYLRETAAHWRDIAALTDEQAAQLIRDDEIDILFDLSGHTAGNRLRVAAYRPASVQISGVGYMNSTGLDAMDYFLSDVHCASDESYFTEKLIYLPHSHICYDAATKLEPAAAPPCLAKGYVTFGSFNQFGKMTDTVLRTWKKIFDAVPVSRLILKHAVMDSEDGKKFVIKRLESFGIDARRVELRGVTLNHFAEYADVDIALDTFPYTGGVTTCEALYMGVPVVSLYGDRHGTRFGLSILTNVGLGELATDSLDEYVKLAVALAGDRELLTILRTNLRGMMKRSPLMDSAGYIRDVEAAFIKILSSTPNSQLPTPNS